MKIKEEFNKQMSNDFKEKEKRMLQQEGLTDDIRNAQEQMLEEINKY